MSESLHQQQDSSSLFVFKAQLRPKLHETRIKRELQLETQINTARNLRYGLGICNRPGSLTVRAGSIVLSSLNPKFYTSGILICIIILSCNEHN